MIAPGITIVSFITLLALLIWTSASGIFGNDDANNGGENNGDYRPWWADMRREELEAIKIILNLVFLIIACGSLYFPISKAGSGYYDRFNEGVLAASIFMFGNMLFVSFWYSMNFGERREGGEEDNNNNNNGGGYNNYGYNRYWYYMMDDRERIAYHSSVVGWVSFVLALVCTAVSVHVFGGATSLPEEEGRGRVMRQSQNSAHVIAQFSLLSEIWTFLSLCTVVVFVALFVAACLMSGGEEAERMREEGKLINLITVLLWMILVTAAMLAWGREVFNTKSLGSLGEGRLYGGAKYFAALLLMVCILFSNPSFDERGREEGVWVATAAAFSCFFLSLMYILFAYRARRYHIDVIDDARAEEASVSAEPKSGMIQSTTGDFVRVEEESGMQMA